MSKEIACLSLVAAIFLSVAHANASVDAATLQKIKDMAKSEVVSHNQQLARASVESIILQNADQKLESLDVRMSTIERVLKFYVNFKNNRYQDAMRRQQPAVVQACCPLKPPSILDKEPWFYGGSGRKRSGEKFSSGAVKEKSQRMENRQRRKNNTQGGRRDKASPSPKSKSN